MTAKRPEFTVEERDARRRVCLAGSWTLFTQTREHKRLAHEFKQLDEPRSLAWDLSEVAALDSAGALFLWRLWGRQAPEELVCPHEYRHWFERFEALPEQPPEPSFSLPRGLEYFGRGLFSITGDIVGLLRLTVTVGSDLALCVTRPRLIPWREITASVYRNGVSSMILLGVTGFVIGVVMALQFGITLDKFGADERIIGLMGTAVLRELGPVIAGLIQAGRAGSAMTAGIGGMHLTEELPALRTFGGSPTLRLVLPKVLAMLLVMPLLVVWTDFTEILGGMALAQIDLGVPHTVFLERFPDSVSLLNFWMGLGKGALFGFCIAVVGCYFGLNAEANTESLSVNTTKSVVVGLTLILVLDASLGAALANVGLTG